MIIKRYTPALKERWDSFVRKSKNGTFLLMRDYMDYHSDRFTDYSLMLLDDNDSIVALLPANRADDVVKSHGGLTYGGLILSDTTSASDILEWFPGILDYLKNDGVKNLQYKPIPHIYHKHPAEEDLYALFRVGANLSVRNLATVIDMCHPIGSSRLGKRAKKRQRNAGIIIEQTDCADSFWNIIVEDRRARHNATPVHTKDEINYLQSKFPNEILFFVAKRDSETLAGAVIFYTGKVIHLQYAAATDAGKELYATDIIYHDIIFNRLTDAEYFDFGTSNEANGQYLNPGMIAHKEEFGGRSIVYDTYEINM